MSAVIAAYRGDRTSEYAQVIDALPPDILAHWTMTLNALTNADSLLR